MSNSKNNDHRTCQVRVGVRVRPLASKEFQQGGKISLSINSPASISIASHKTFTYDAVFDSQTDQDSLYHSVSTSLLESFVDGYNATVRLEYDVFYLLKSKSQNNTLTDV